LLTGTVSWDFKVDDHHQLLPIFARLQRPARRYEIDLDFVERQVDARFVTCWAL
jgi:hypothetical protein